MLHEDINPARKRFETLQSATSLWAPVAECARVRMLENIGQTSRDPQGTHCDSELKFVLDKAPKNKWHPK